MQLDRWQRQLLCNVRVLQFARLIDGLALDPFGGQTTGSDCRATAERLELGIDNLPVRIHFYLQFHYIATGRSTDQSSAHCDVLLVEGAHVARVLVVVDDLSEDYSGRKVRRNLNFRQEVDFLRRTYLRVVERCGNALCAV